MWLAAPDAPLSHALTRSMSLSARYQDISKEYQKLQAELQLAVDARQRLDAQLQENQMVKKVCLVLSIPYFRIY